MVLRPGDRDRREVFKSFKFVNDFITRKALHTLRQPLHGSTAGTARCFSVNTNAHTFPCFKCNRSGNALELWAEANRLSIYDAAIDLCQRLNVPLPTLAPPPTANREEEPVATASSTCTIP